MKKFGLLFAILRKPYIIVGIIVNIVVGLLDLYYVSFIPSSVFEFLFKTHKMVQESAMNILLAQFSLTFLVISLLSVLSQKGDTLYWVDINNYKLIEPKYGSFRDITDYAFVFLGASCISIIFSFYELLAIDFALGVIALTWMTYKMIGIHFDRESIVKELKKELHNKYYNALNEDFDVILSHLYENTSRALIERDFSKVKENIIMLADFYAELPIDCLYEVKRKMVYEKLYGMLDETSMWASKVFWDILYARDIMHKNEVFDIVLCVIKNRDFYNYTIDEEKIFLYILDGYWKINEIKKNINNIGNKHFSIDNDKIYDFYLAIYSKASENNRAMFWRLYYDKLIDIYRKCFENPGISKVLAEKVISNNKIDKLIKKLEDDSAMWRYECENLLKDIIRYLLAVKYFKKHHKLVKDLSELDGEVNKLHKSWNDWKNE